MQNENLYLYVGLGMAAVFFVLIKLLSKVNESRRIEKQTAFLELQGYKRKLRKENAMKYLDNDLLVSLDSRNVNKSDAQRIIQDAKRKVSEGQFIEERARQDKKDSHSAWLG